MRKRTLGEAGIGEGGTPSLKSSVSQRADGREGEDTPRANSATNNTSTHPAWLRDEYADAVEEDVTQGIMLDPALQAANESRRSSQGIAFNELQNPSDALGILAQIASRGGGESECPYPSSPSSCMVVGSGIGFADVEQIPLIMIPHHILMELPPQSMEPQHWTMRS